jgi:hypothetical protein
MHEISVKPTFATSFLLFEFSVLRRTAVFIREKC